MEATRCPQCGETRWHLMGLPVKRATTCSTCGTELLPERRLPGRRAKAAKAGLTERRVASSTRSPARPAF